uniref:PLAT domain-containing protein n=1 Tax=Arundo donax TaxID=35708 RepID=A0A0A8ZVS9_ARUDO
MIRSILEDERDAVYLACDRWTE